MRGTQKYQKISTNNTHKNYAETKENNATFIYYNIIKHNTHIILSITT